MARKKPIISPLGQWAYPGEVTVIPSSNITMKGVNYPVLGIDDLGNQQIMMPGGEYDFPGNYVTEYPQMNKGGQMIKRKDGSYSKRGLWDNIRANKGSGKKPTKEMLEQERKIKAKMQNGGWLDQYQVGGSMLSMGDYDLTTAPKRGNYLLPDINRPSYIDDAGERRTEYKIGKNIEGKETLIPTVVGGRQLSEDEALDRYRKTGLHMGQYNTPEEADYAARLRTARYNMLEDPIRFQADQFQVGGVRRPIYTSNPRDPRIGRYTDSLNLYKKGESDYASYLKTNKRLNIPSTSTHIENNPYVYDGDTPAKIQPIISHRYWYNHNPDVIAGTNIPSKTIKEWTDRYKKPVQPIYYGVNTKPTPSKKSILTKVSQPIYKKPEIIPDVVDIPQTVAPIESPVKKIGYSKPIIQQFNYMSNENKAKALQKYGSVGDIPFQGVDINQLKDGGWLNKYQVGGWDNWTPNVGKPYMRTSPAGNAGYSDNTRVVTQNTNVTAANRKAAEAGEYARKVGSISQGRSRSAYEKAKEASSLVAQAEQRKGSADPLDYVLDMVNPATYAFAGTDLVGNTGSAISNTAQGNFKEAGSDLLNAGMNALYLLPAKGLAKTIASPIAFRPVEGMMYRGLGKEGFKDAVQSGVFRPKQLNYAPGRSVSEIGNTPKQFSSTYYAPSKKFGVIENYGPDYVAEVPFNEQDFFRRYSKRNDWSYSTPKQIPISEGKILKKDWLLGYKPVNVSNAQPISKPINYFDDFDNLTYEGTRDLYESIPHPYYKEPIQEAVDLWQDYKYISPELENAFTVKLNSQVPVTRYLKEKPQFDTEGYLISKGPTSFAVGPGNKNFGENRIFLNIPENTRVAPISKGASNTNFQRERELLLSSDTKYRKVNSRVNPETGLEDYYMEIVPKKQGGQTSWLNKYK